MLILIDGNSLLFRAYYGVRATMSRSDGVPTNAVYGFMNMILPIISGAKSDDKIVCVFDASKTTFRNKIYPEYKANRQSTPEDLVKQIEIVRGAVRSMGVPVLCVPDVEADDVIATLTYQNKSNCEIQIVTSDKDLMQLIEDNVSLYDGGKSKTIRTPEVFEKFGVRPDQVIDTQSLMGDSTDNVPGVKGIGPKKAAELITEFDSLDGVYENLDKIQNERTKNLLTEYKQNAYISKELVKLKTDVDLDGLELGNFVLNSDTAIEFAKTQIESKSLVEKIQKMADKKNVQKSSTTPEQTTIIPDDLMACDAIDTETIAPTKTDSISATYDAIQTVAELDSFLKTVKNIIAIDTETTGLNQMADKIVGISMATTGNRGVYVPIRHKSTQVDLFASDSYIPNQLDMKTVYEKLWPILTDENIIKVGHNLKYDFHILENENWDTTKIKPIDDTMLMSYALYGSKHLHNLDDLADKYLNHTNIAFSSLFPPKSDNKNFDELEIKNATPYAAEDAVVCLELYNLFHTELKKSPDINKLYREIDLPLMPVLLKMERNGVALDIEKLNTLSILFHQKITETEQKIWKIVGHEFNISSPKQLATILFDELNLPANKKRSTDADTLNELSDSHEIIPLVLEHRSISKLAGTYTDSLSKLAGKDGRIHTSYLQTSTNTGRLSSRNPNLQNIPIKTELGEEIRKCFIAESGKVLICIDYSQMQLRLMADFADVKVFKETFNKNQDIHEQTARKIFNIPADVPVAKDLRRAAKTVNFSIIYGISSFGLGNLLNISATEAQRTINSYLEGIPEIKTYIEKIKAFANDNGYVLTPHGRKIELPDVKNPRLRSYAMRAAINAPIQGFEADIMRKVLIKLDKLFEKDNYIKMILQIHDEIVFECDEDYATEAANRIKQEMENIEQLSVPLEADWNIEKFWGK